ncbi:MAG: hypothetical protein ND866_21775 [Pyrinomonadaceae bacterium]|nr:hypothetical protein [Pyrinomonadaceae bacterium]
MDLEIVSEIRDIETIAIGSKLREVSRLRRTYGDDHQANEAERLLAVFERECEGDAAMIDLFLDEKAFYEFFTQKRFEALRTK